MAELLKSAPPVWEWRPSKSQRRAWRRLRLATYRQVVVDFGSWLGPLDYGGIGPPQQVEQWLQEPACECSKRRPDTISYNAGTRACEKGTENSASEMREARVEPDAINYSAAIRECEKGEAKLEPGTRHGNGNSECEKREAKIEPDAISYIAGTRTCEKGATKLEPDIASHGTGISACEKQVTTIQPDIISCSAGTRECEKGEAKLEPISISTGNSVCEKVAARAEPNAISCSAEINVCEKGQVQLEPDIISISTGNCVCDKQAARTEPNASNYNAEISVCEKGQAKLELECEMREAKLEDDELEDDFAAFADACMDGTDSDSDERVYSRAAPRDLYEELCSDMADLVLVGRPAAMRSYLRNRFRLIGDINFDDVCTELVDLVGCRRLGEMEDLLRERFAPVGDQPVDEEREDIDGGRIGILGIGPPSEATCPQQ